MLIFPIYYSRDGFWRKKKTSGIAMEGRMGNASPVRAPPARASDRRAGAKAGGEKYSAGTGHGASPGKAMRFVS